jgi:hypothetical protein
MFGLRAMGSLTTWATAGLGYRVQFSFDEATRDQIDPTGAHGRLSGWGEIEVTLHPADP